MMEEVEKEGGAKTGNDLSEEGRGLEERRNCWRSFQVLLRKCFFLQVCLLINCIVLFGSDSHIK